MAGGTYFGPGPVPKGCTRPSRDDPARGYAVDDQRGSDNEGSSDSYEEGSESDSSADELYVTDELGQVTQLDFDGSDCDGEDEFGEGSPAECFDD